MLLGESRDLKNTQKKDWGGGGEEFSGGTFFIKLQFHEKKTNFNIHNDLDRNLHVVNKIQQLSSVFSFC